MEQLVATDGWLKDYDPLFDLFDEEMRSSRGSQMAASCHSSDYFNEYDLNNNYYSPYCKQTDELSLILGLEWLPSNELNSPSTSSLSSSSSTTSSSSSSSSACSTTSSSSSSSSTTSSQQTSYSVNPSDSAQCSQQSSTHQPQEQTAITARRPKTPQNKPTTITSTSCQQQQRVFRIQLQNNNSKSSKLGNLIHQLPLTHSNELNQPTSGACNGGPVALKQKSCLVVNSNNNLIATNLIEPAQIVTACGNLKRKKKCLRTKGTSLLAHPSPKAANNSTCSSSTSSSPMACATSRAVSSSTLPTLITINKPSNIMSSPLQQQKQQQQQLPKTTTLLSTTTTLISSNHTTPFTCITGKATNNANLTSLDKTMKYCVKIEHSYSMMC